MEYIKYGDMFDFINKKSKCKLNIDDARKIFCQLISCIEYCHGNLISHRDIKLENILIFDEENLLIKITDFGLSNYIKVDSLHNTACGSLEYAAPEIINGENYNPMKSDIWSMGVVLYCMVTGNFPWSSSLEKKNFLLTDVTEIKNHKIYNTIGDEKLKDLLSKIFVPASERISINELKKHVWLANYVIPSYLPIREPLREIYLIIIDKIVSLGFKPESIFMSIYNNLNTQETAIYNLLKDKLESKLDKPQILQNNRRINHTNSDHSLNYGYRSSLPIKEPLWKIDLIIINKIVSFGFKPENIFMSIYNNLNTQETEIYNLLKDKAESKSGKSQILKNNGRINHTNSDHSLTYGHRTSLE